MTTRTTLAARLASYGLLLVCPTLANASVPARHTQAEAQLQEHQRPVEVIYKGVGGVSTEAYFRQLQLPEQSDLEPPLTIPPINWDEVNPNGKLSVGMKKLLSTRNSLAPENRFPLSTVLRFANPVVLENRDITKPFFFVGLDSISMAWLDRQHQNLVRIDAQGFVVAGEQYSDYQILRKFADEVGLSLAVLPADHFANSIGVETYPSVVVPVTSE
jgi:integrating conjugative element protein (TIGR03765 family)